MKKDKITKKQEFLISELDALVNFAPVDEIALNKEQLELFRKISIPDAWGEYHWKGHRIKQV